MVEECLKHDERDLVCKLSGASVNGSGEKGNKR
jgi:hypothetical protein